jgi:predicted dehydrogenase
MAVHDLDMSRFLAGADPIEILAMGSCHIDKSIEVLEGSEKYDTASCLVRYPNGVQAMVDVCRRSSYGYDQRAEVLGTKGMIQTDNVYPNTAKTYKNGKFSLWALKLPSWGQLIYLQLCLTPFSPSDFTGEDDSDNVDTLVIKLWSSLTHFDIDCK